MPETKEIKENKTAYSVQDSLSEKELVAAKQPSDAIKTAYIVRFRKGSGAVLNLNFLAENDDDAKKRSKAFCLKHQFHHVYTKPFFTDLETWESLM